MYTDMFNLPKQSYPFTVMEFPDGFGFFQQTPFPAENIDWEWFEEHDK